MSAPGSHESKAKVPEDTTEFNVRTIQGARENGHHRPFLTVSQGMDVGKTVFLGSESLVLGRDLSCGMPLLGRGLSRQHARLDHRDNHYVISDLGSTNGVRVNGEKVPEKILAAGDRIQLGPETLIKYRLEDPRDVELRVKQYERSIRDDQLEIFNRGFFLTSLERELAYICRRQEISSVVLLDIDHFKQVNDTFGHPVGDVVIAGVAKAINPRMRREDVFARYGGEEFAMLFRGLSANDTYSAAERYRKLIASLSFPITDADVHPIRVTVSLGCVTFAKGSHSSVGDIMAEADKHLYQAKRFGRNCTIATPPEARL